MLKKVCLTIFSIILLPAFVYAQKEPAPQGGAVAPEAVTMTQEGNVSLDFREADIRNVLKILALKSGVNIVASPEVTGIVTIQLNNVPWQNALEVILQTYGFASERKGNIIVVTTVENLKKRRDDATLLAEQEPLETRTFTLNFSKASEVVTSIQKMKSERGTVEFDQRTNTLIVTDASKKLELIESVVQTLDSTTPQVLIEAKIVETTLSNAEKLGIDWNLTAKVIASARATTFPFKQTSTNKYLQDSFQGISDDDFKYGTLDFNSAQAVFDILKSRSDTNILSNPRIVTLDNRPAKIVVGSQYPIPTYTYNEEQARLQVSGWEYKDIGIIFDVTPHVNSAGYVTLEILPKITAILDFVTVENTSLPRLSNESTNTSVLIKDGETLVIAGLLKDQLTDTKKKLPLFGDIPVIGLAFTHTDKAVAKTDLMMFITPHIITPELAAK